MALVAGSPAAMPCANDPSVAIEAFWVAVHAAVGVSSAPALAAIAERTKVRRSMFRFMATAFTRCAPGRRAGSQPGHAMRRQPAVSPPSMTSAEPVTKAAASEAR
jgi:hypothetical protein